MLYLAIFIPPGYPLPPREILDEPGIKIYAEEWGRPGDSGLKAINGQVAVGAVWLRLWNVYEKGFGFVEETIPELSLAVVPDFRGQGIGSRLLTNLFQTINGQLPAVSLSVSCQNPAHRLYKRFGFTVVENKEDSLVMVKQLQQPS